MCKGGGFRKKIYQLETDHTDDHDGGSEHLFVGTVTDNKHPTKTEQKWQAVLNVQGHNVQFKLDTGAEANVLPVTVFNRMKSVKLEKTKTLLCAFGEHQVIPLGTVTLDCTTSKGDSERLLFYVTDSADVPILSHKACDDLNVIMNQPMQTPSLAKDRMTHEYKDVFTGVGEYDKVYHMELNPDAQGVIQPPRKIPYAIQPKLKEALDRLKVQYIIADVDSPTEWVNNLVIVEKKSGALKLCLDPRPLNAAIKRERHAIPTPSDVQAQLSGKQVLTVVDMKHGYWHVKIS